MGKDGRIYIPELVLAFFKDEEKQSLAGSVFEVPLNQHSYYLFEQQAVAGGDFYEKCGILESRALKKRAR
jgi:hypothetical protein